MPPSGPAVYLLPVRTEKCDKVTVLLAVVRHVPILWTFVLLTLSQKTNTSVFASGIASGVVFSNSDIGHRGFHPVKHDNLPRGLRGSDPRMSACEQTGAAFEPD